MSEPSAGYERELGGINATLKGIEVTLTGLNHQLGEDRADSHRWRQTFRDALTKHAERTDDALDALSERTTTLETDLESHKLEDERGRKLIWKVLLGGTGAGGSVFLAWSQAKAAAILSWFR